MRCLTGGYAAQILAYENDVLRLLQHLQLHVDARQANYAAVMLCRFSARVDGLSAYIDTHPGQGSSNPHANLTLTLLHPDTTWRFDHYENRLASPKLSWPTILQFFSPGSCVGVDLILRKQFPRIEASCITPLPAYVLHVEIGGSAESDSIIDEMAGKLRHALRFWTQQLIFELDPATSELPKGSTSYVLIQEFDTRHTAETLAASLDSQLLRQLADKRIAQASIRIYSMEGSATYHNATPQDVDELVIQNKTHAEMFGEQGPGETYFGISPNAYINL